MPRHRFHVQMPEDVTKWGSSPKFLLLQVSCLSISSNLKLLTIKNAYQKFRSASACQCGSLSSFEVKSVVGYCSPFERR